MAVLEIPLTPEPQAFNIGVVRLRFGYANQPEAGWFMDILTQEEEPIACGLPLVTGTDILGQFAYLGFNGALYVVIDGNPGRSPTFTELGSTARLYFVTA